MSLPRGIEPDISEDLPARVNEYVCDIEQENLKQAEQIAALQAELERDAWVSVDEDNKPLYGLPVYVFTDFGDVFVAVRTKENPIDVWSIRCSPFRDGGWAKRVTHWKPITPPHNKDSK